MNKSHALKVLLYRILKKPNQGETAKIIPAVAVGAAYVIGVVSAATEVDMREENKMKRAPKQRRKRKYTLKPFSRDEDLQHKMQYFKG